MNHTDCKYYLAIDNFKGLCKRTKDPVGADEPACDDFEKAPQCRHCKYYSMNEEYLGLCMGETMAYPDLKAETCRDFSWN